MKKRLIAVAILTVLSLMVTGLASGLSKTIQGTTGVTVQLDGSPVEYTYENGVRAEAFLSQDGVTYLPVRAIAEALGLTVGWDPDTQTVTLDSPAADGPGAQEPQVPATPENAGVSYASSYQEVVKALDTGSGYRGWTNGMVLYDEAVTAEASAEPEEAPMPAPTMSADDDAADAGQTQSAGADYSQTNVQVQGVDEGDIVKTDGTYIYQLSDQTLRILLADGTSTRLISSTSLGEEYGQQTTDDMPGYDYYYAESSKYPYELYLSGDRLAILCDSYSCLEYQTAGSDWFWQDTSYTCLDIYDVSDRTAPRLLCSLGQDGSSLSSRLLDGKVYLVSNYSVWDWDDADPRTYVPCLYQDGVGNAFPVDCIALWPEQSSNTYAVVGVYDLDACRCTDQMSVLGGGDTVYMNQENLYIAGTEYSEQTVDTWRESVYTVEEHSSGQNTTLLRLALDGELTVDAAGTVPGYLESQFSLDEYNGYLRLVTTRSGSTWRIYTDDNFGFTNYDWGSDSDSNSLWVLDADLKTVGSLENLAEDEIVYSVRFVGDIAYFCTFRQTDPLFAVDLSDPERPTVLSALKISGFSDYLHSWSDGLLFGLGMEADADTGWTQCMKLTMFDVSDPADVTAATCATLPDETWSVALDNHKALLIDPDKNLICFPAGDRFYLYSYTSDGGFALRARLDLEVSSWDARAVYIGRYLYIVSPQAVAILDLDALTLAASLPLD